MYYYGIQFFIDEDGRVKECKQVRDTEPIIEKIDEIVHVNNGNVRVERTVIIPIESNYREESEEEIARKWWNKFSEKRLLKVLRGD